MSVNPRWRAALAMYGEGMRPQQFFEFITQAKQFAYARGFGVVKTDCGLRVADQDLFTIACEWFAMGIEQT